MAGQDLNDKQRQAVEHSGGLLLVLAGPGTGKTGVLVARIEHLVANRGVGPARILALIFSRRAAANRLWGVEPEKMRLVYVFTHDGSIVAVDNETGFLERAEKRVLDAVERIKGVGRIPQKSLWCTRTTRRLLRRQLHLRPGSD